MNHSILSFLATHIFLSSVHVACPTSTTTTTVTSTSTVSTSTVIVSAKQHKSSTTTVTMTSETIVTTTLTPNTPPIEFTFSPPTSTASASMSTTTSSQTGIYSGSSLQQAILNSTNHYRNEHQAGPLDWNSTLASFAQRHAQQCIWEHSGGPYGENLAENYATPTLAVDAWAGEEGKYDYEKQRFTESTGHYTQLVWKGTTTVGCGAVNCGGGGASEGADGWYLVCEYWPRGNAEGKFGENVLKAGGSREGLIWFTSGGGAAAGARSEVGAWKGWVAVSVAVGLFVFQLM